MAAQYRPNPQKSLEGLIWIACNAPDIDHYWVVKIMFGADKLHLNRYGRPVFGDQYVAMEYGPVPSLALRIINSESDHYLYPKNAKDSLDVTASGMGKRIIPKRQPDMDVFSRTDIECLVESLNKYKDYSFGELVKETHEEPSWKVAWDARGEKAAKNMDYLLLIDSDNEDLIDYINETACGAVF